MTDNNSNYTYLLLYGYIEEDYEDYDEDDYNKENTNKEKKLHGIILESSNYESCKLFFDQIFNFSVLESKFMQLFNNNFMQLHQANFKNHYAYDIYYSIFCKKVKV